MNHALLLPALLELLAKSALLLVGAAALTAGARRSSAAQRHSLWLAVFAALLLLPLTKSIPPRWHLPGSPAAPVVTVLPAMSEIVLVSSPIAAAPVPPVKKFHLPAPSHLALIAWLAGTMAIVGFRLLGSLQIAWLERRSVIGSSACLTTLAGQAAKEMNLRTPCAIRLATAVSVPCTWGFWRPVVLLPAAAEEEWAEERLLAALRHEFAHVARRDYLARWVALLACALYWPNPLVWLSVRRLRLAQEQACDDLVLRAGTPPADYAALLVETARASLGSGAGWRAAVAMARPSTLEGRVIAIVDGTRNRRPAGRPAAVVGALGMVAFIGASALAQIAPRQAAPTTPAASAAPAPEKAVDGIADGATLGLLPIRSQSEAEDGSVKHFTLHIPIKARPATEIDPADLVVHVLFYDMVDGQKILPTTAAVQSQWAAPPANWSKGGVEELKVEYQLSKPETEAAKNENRKYFGYIVRVYYHGKIQAEASDVPRLLQQFPGKAELLPSAAAPADRELEELSLRAYTIFTQAEKLEGARQFPEALAKMKSVLPLLDRITALNFRWQPQVVAYRRERTVKAIHRLEPLAAPGAPPIPGLTPVQSPANASSLAPSASAALNKARTIVIPKVELREATLVEALDFLRTKATELDPDKSGVNIILPPGVDSVPIGSAGARPADARITISLTNVPLDEALRYVTELAGLELRAEPHALVLQLPPVAAPAEAKSAAAPGAAPIVAPAESAALQKAEKIIIPKIETREATLPEMLDFLHAKAIEFDPEKTGVNIVLQPGTESDARITVSLTNIPLSEALRYTASLANLQVRAEPNALVLAPPVKAAAGNPKIEIQGGTLTFNQPSKTAVLAGNTPAATPAPVATDALTKLPVNLTADRTRVENGIAIAEGDARFSGGPYTAKADSIRYNIAQHSVRLTGKVEVQTGANTLTGEDVEVFLDGAGRITAHGPLQTVVRPAGQVAMPVFPKNKKPFTKGDGIEIRELSGSSPTFRVGETYHVRGVCRQNSIQNAVLYLGITAEGDEDAIKPAPGTSLSKTAPKGVTEFDFAFTPLRPGKVHITLYDVDNYNPKDNASEGLYLGEVSL